MKTTRTAIVALLVLLLAGCKVGDSSNGPNKSAPAAWKGGLFKVYEPPDGTLTKARLILHQGHCKFDCAYEDAQNGNANLIPVAEQFAQAGYIVYAFEMPPLPHAGPVERFYKPVLDLISGWDDSMPIYMMGFSGGGWTTTVVTALEPRIAKGYSVQGDAAHYPSQQRCAELDGDEFELCNPPQPYDDLYALAGSRLLHIYDYHVNGSISLPNFPATPNYPFIVDYTATRHEWTTWTTDYILNDLNILTPL